MRDITEKVYLCGRKALNITIMAIDRVAYWIDIANYNIEARYPEDKETIARTLTEQFCRQMIDETKQLQQWIKDKL